MRLSIINVTCRNIPFQNSSDTLMPCHREPLSFSFCRTKLSGWVTLILPIKPYCPYVNNGGTAPILIQSQILGGPWAPATAVLPARDIPAKPGATAHQARFCYGFSPERTLSSVLMGFSAADCACH